MKAVRYLFPRANFERVMRPVDLERLGILNVKQEFNWNSGNDFTIVMNNKLSESLVAVLPGEFIALDSDQADEDVPVVLEPLTSLAHSGAGNPQESLNDSKDDADDDDESSTHSASDQA